MSVTRCPNDKISRILRLKVLWWEEWLSTEISIIGLPFTVSAFQLRHGSIPSGPEWEAILTAYFADMRIMARPGHVTIRSNFLSVIRLRVASSQLIET